MPTYIGCQGPGGCDVLFYEILVRHPEPELRLDEDEDLQQTHGVDAGRLERVVRLDRTAAGHDGRVDERGQDLGDLVGIVHNAVAQGLLTLQPLEGPGQSRLGSRLLTGWRRPQEATICQPQWSSSRR